MKREEIASHLKWKLEDIYPHEQAWEEEYRLAESLARDILAFQGKLEDAETLYACLSLSTNCSLTMERLFVYASMKKDEDTRNSQAQGKVGRVQSLSVNVSQASSYIEPEILKIGKENMESFYITKPELRFYQKIIEKILEEKDHVLSEEQEALLSQVGDLSSAPRDIFGALNNADMQFPTIEDEEGKLVKITHGNFLTFLESADRSIRKAAFEAVYGTYGKQKNTIAATFAASIKKDVFYAKVRKYTSSLEKALKGKRISEQVYTNLIDTVKKHLPSMNRYLALRKKALQVENLHFYDLYVPLISSVKKDIPYEEAYGMMKEGLAPLGKEYISKLEEAYTAGWIDVCENEGKRSGAYSWGPYGTHPYVLLNYQNGLNDLFTLAHEMGHAMHSYYSDTNHPFPYAQYTIFVAEVASTVNETLLMFDLLKKSQSKEEKIYLINEFLDKFRGTVFRQTMFAEFEKIVHEQVEQGESLTMESLCSVYRDLNQTYYGKETVIDEEIALEWARIPHFYNPFYVYQYATGFSAAVALSKAILEEGQPAVDRYLAFLKSGGSDYPLELLKKAGVDMTTPQPIEEALQMFGELVNELESLMK